MLVVEKKCKVCKLIKTNKPLLKRIYDSSWFLPHSKDTLKDISTDYKGLFGYESILNHVKKHQFIDSNDYNEKMLQHIDQQAEKNAVRKAVKATDAIQSVIDRGMERLDSGEIDVKDVNQIIRASQVKLSADAKAKDQELATMEMVAHFLSGENAGDRIYVENEAQTT